MAPRAFWKGYLKLSLVTCPVAMTPVVTQNEKVRFRTLNRATGHPIQSRYIDAVTHKPVDEEEQVKGYERGEDEYIALEDEEIAAVALESTRTIDIDMFVDLASIDWIWFDRPHFLVPDDDVGEEAFCVIRDAMAATGKAGLSRLVLYRREHAVLLIPRGKGIVLWTLRYGDEVREEKPYFEAIKDKSVDAKLLSLISNVIEERSSHWDAKMLRDPVQEELLAIIEAKKKGKQPAKAKAPKSSGNVINIMDALRKSLASEKSPRKR